MAKREYKAIRNLRIKKGDDLRTIYAKVKRSFTAADLAQYCNNEPGIPAEKVLADLESLARARPGRRKKK